jgi:ABC-2 type transport system ATP-binding protein
LGTLDVLRGVDLNMAPGGIAAVLRPNGAGDDHDRQDPVHSAPGGRRDSSGRRPDVAGEPGRVREQISLTGPFAAVDEWLTGRAHLVLVARLPRLKGAGASPTTSSTAQPVGESR